MKGFADIGRLPEDEQIRLIGTRASTGEKVGFIVRHNEKIIARYIRKLQARFPGLTVQRIGRITHGCYALSAQGAGSN